MRLILIIASIHLIVSCQGRTKHDPKVLLNENIEDVQTINPIGKSDSIKKLKTFQKWVFQVNNNNANHIGYKTYTDDESIGVKSICIDSVYVYITDVYHNNIKRINILDGELVSSKNLADLPTDESGIWLRDILVFNNKLYVTSDMSAIYIFSKELDFQKSFYVKKGRKHIECIHENSIEIFMNDKQLADKSIERKILSFDINGDTIEIKRIIPICEYSKQLSQKNVQGKPYKTFLKDNKTYFESEYGIYEVNNSIPRIEAYDAQNINFNISTIVFFDSSPQQFTLYVYTY